MPRTLSDEEYSALLQRKQVADFAEAMYNDPSVSDEMKALIKRRHPNLQIADYDLEQRLNKRLDAERQEREEKEEAKRKKDEDEHFKRLRKKTMDDYHLTEEGISEVEQVMVDKNIGDYEAAAMFVASKKPRATDSFNDDRGHWNHEKQDGWGDIAKDPEGWGRSEIMKALRTDQQRMRNGS